MKSFLKKELFFYDASSTSGKMIEFQFSHELQKTRLSDKKETNQIKSYIKKKYIKHFLY